MTTLDALARDSGTFLMVAMDQRESLRGMLGEHRPAPIEDERLIRFKLAVARELAPHAGAAAAAGAIALKFLVVWRDDSERARRFETAHCFVEIAHGAGLLSVLEGVVRPPSPGESFDREAAIVEAARELASVAPSLYKVAVPLHGRGDPAELERRCRELDAAIECPWVVLSSGVEPDDFPAAVEAACRAGASGILAGRALWRNALGADDPTFRLRHHAAPRLQFLGEIVDRHGKPWAA